MSGSGRVLADTHVLLWYLQASPRLDDSTRVLLDDVTASNEAILVSAVTIVEIHYLGEKGTLSDADIDAVHAVLDAEGSSFDIVPIDAAVAWAVGGVSRDAVGDPFDRMIAATSLINDVPLVTYDRRLEALSGLTTWR